MTGFLLILKFTDPKQRQQLAHKSLFLIAQAQQEIHTSYSWFLCFVKRFLTATSNRFFLKRLSGNLLTCKITHIIIIDVKEKLYYGHIYFIVLIYEQKQNVTRKFHYSKFIVILAAIERI